MDLGNSIASESFRVNLHKTPFASNNNKAIFEFGSKRNPTFTQESSINEMPSSTTDPTGTRSISTAK
jgi:hypothetical protein